MSFINRIQTGDVVVGTCVTSNNPLWPDAIKFSGLDFVFIDTEHISLSRNDLAEMCHAYAGREVVPIVRVYKADHHLICQAIDAGAQGVVIPYVESAEEVRELIGATKYRPLKGEKLHQYLNHKEKLSDALKRYLDQYNEGHLSIVNIESVPAIEKLEEILAVPGLNAVFIGPHDLSVSMGIPEQYDHPAFIEKVREIIKTSRKFGLGVGIHFSEAIERQVFWVKEGVNIVIHSSDYALFTQRLNADLDVVRNLSGKYAGHNRNSGENKII